MGLATRDNPRSGSLRGAWIQAFGPEIARRPESVASKGFHQRGEFKIRSITSAPVVMTGRSSCL
jgi:hypothetical protein